MYSEELARTTDKGTSNRGSTFLREEISILIVRNSPEYGRGFLSIPELEDVVRFARKLAAYRPRVASQKFARKQSDDFRSNSTMRPLMQRDND